MTEPTYFARIGNEAEREMAELFNVPHFLSSMHENVELGDLLCYTHTRRKVCVQKKDWAIAGVYEGIPFSEFIRRFVPLSVIGALAECHGMYVVDNESIEIIEQSGYTGNKHLTL